MSQGVLFRESIPDGRHELVIDNFAGGGGASKGIELAIGRSVDIAINHDPDAIAMHMVNHPGATHYCESVWDIDPWEVTKGRPVGLAWFSPDYKHFSKAKGGKPVEKNIRGLAWVVLKWAGTVRPRVIILENVEEFQTWGPLLPDGRPNPRQKGRTFNSFTNALKRQGYQVDYRELRACDYGAPTSRNRFFLITRCDGFPIVWPEPTHGDPKSSTVISGKLKPWRVAAEVIDWSRPCPSVFDNSDEIRAKYGLNSVRPLADNTMKRIAKGTVSYVINNHAPFIMKAYGGNYSGCGSPINAPLPTITTRDHNFLVMPFLQQYHSFSNDGARGQTLNKPLLTIDTNLRYALTAAFLTKYYSNEKRGVSIIDPLHTVTTKDRLALIETPLCVLRNNMDCKDLKEPIPTITTSPGHFAKVRTVLTKIIGDREDLAHWPQVREILNKYCGYSIADDEILLLQINGKLYFISDIGMRMLASRELYDAQGFPATYIINHDYYGNPFSKALQVKMCGNSVPPLLAKALTQVNRPDLCRVAA